MLSAQYPNFAFFTCIEHQLNLMAGKILTNESTRECIAQPREIFAFSSTFPKQHAILQRILQEVLWKTFELVAEGDTRWYSYYSLHIILCEERKALEEYRESAV